MKTKTVGNENIRITRYAATQCMILLENTNKVLPLTNKTIALFWGGCYATVKGGTGSGNVSNSYEISIYQGFKSAGYTVYVGYRYFDSFNINLLMNLGMECPILNLI